MRVFRPHLDDVENLSHGKGAKRQRGTGSRQVCHRLNQDERKRFEMAKQTGYLVMKGTGYRKNRKGSPLFNIYRQRCDALEEIAVMIDQRADQDTLLIDFSTLRVANDARFVAAILEDVLRPKYPVLYQNLTQEVICFSSQGICLEALQNNPIWGVAARIMSIGCDRDVAKNVAKDIVDRRRHLTILETDLVPSTEQKRDESADDSIEVDWNDI